jgi:protein-arginine kinase activator protein McsA
MTITCTQCGKEVPREKISELDDNSLFVCKNCATKSNATQIEKEKKINAKLAGLVAAGKPYVLEQVVKEVEIEMS